MKKYFSLNENGFIKATSDLDFPQEEQAVFDFPDDFDFSKQGDYKIIDDELILAVDEAEKQAEKEYWKSIPYDEAVDTEIRKRYSVSQEFAILRQKDEKPEEYDAYYAYCEECKAFVKKKKKEVE